MSQTSNGRHLANRPMTRSPRPRPRMPRRPGLLLGALALVVAAIIAIPALVALAAPPVKVEIAPATNTASLPTLEGAVIYKEDATYTVTVTVPEGYTLTEGEVTLSATDSDTVKWSGDSASWSKKDPTEEGGPTVYTRNVTVTGGSWNQISVGVPYTANEGGESGTAEGKSGLITVDKNAPVVTISMSADRIGYDDTNSTDIYGSKDLTATVTVEDSSFDSSATTVNDNMDLTWSGTHGIYTTEVDCKDIHGINVVAHELADSNRTTEYSYGDDVENLGNRFEIDTNIPRVTLKLKNADGEELSGSTFNRDVIVEATVNMTRWGTVSVVENNGTTQNADDPASGWTVNENTGDKNTRIYTKTFKAEDEDEDEDEGNYTIVFTARKKGFFSEETSNPATFTLDKTAPKANVSYNLQHANTEDSTSYFDTKVNDLTATIQVTEDLSFDQSKINVTTGDNQPAKVSWNEKTGTVTFDKNGSYTLNITGADGAGNPLSTEDSSVKIPSSIVTDGTDPEINITYVDDENKNVEPNENGFFNCPVTPTVSITETNFDAGKTSVSVDGGLVDVEWKQKDNNSNIYEATLSQVSAETKHTIVVMTADKANHDAEKSFEFTIDTTPLTFDVKWENDPDAGDTVTDESGTTTYYPGSRTAIITPSDLGFDGSGITISTGSENVQAVWNQKDEEGNWTVRFPSDGSYRLKVSGYDQAGNTAVAYDSQPFVIDTAKPELEVTFDDAPADVDESSDVSYYSSGRTATITVTEQNFNPERVTIETGNTAAQLGEWNDGENGVHTLEVTFPESASPYDLKVSVTDRANNPAESAYDSGRFVVDTTPAAVSVHLDQQLVQSVNSVDYFAAAPTATVTVRDVNFKPADSNIAVTGGTVATVGDWTEGETDENGVTTWTAPVTFTEGTGRTLNVTATDWAARATTNAYGTNTTDSQGTQLSSATLTADLTAPEVTSASVDRNPVNNYGDNYYFNAATTLTVNVSDNIGLESLTMTDADEGYYVLDNQVEAGATSGTVTIGFADGHDFDRAITVRTTDLAHNYRYWSIAPDGTVQAVNYADPSNEPVFDGTYPESMLQDTVAPVVSLSGVEAGTYYNAPQSVLLSVDELNMPILRTYEPDQTVLTVTRVAGDASGATTTWTRPLSQLGSTSGITYQLSEPFATDGHYTVSAQVTDPARNQDTAQIGEFTIDQTAPTVEVSFDNNDVLNGRYYRAGRTATITVVEHNFDPSLVTIDTNGAVGSWSTNGDTHTIQVSFSTDGVYNLAVSGSDRAGNQMTPYQADEFVVDLTAPTVTISGVEDSTAYNGVVEPQVSFADEANFDANGTTYTLTGTKNGVVSYDAATYNEGQGSTVSFADFAREADVDDIYTLSAHMTDLAGNEAEASVTFSVNRFGSTFRVLDAGSYTANDGYLTERRDVVIEEINVSGVASEQHAVTVTEGTTVSDLTLNETAQDTGYTIESGTSTDADSNGWSVYTYRVAAGNFVNDGRYHVAVESVDRADNTNSSASYYDRSTGEAEAAEVDFILDTTDPVITNLNVADGQTYDSNVYQGSFTVVENIGLRDVEVVVDGEKVQATDDGYGNYTFEVSAASFTPRDLQITATDLAGRTGTAGAEGFHVTTDILELHLPWVIAGGVVVLAAVGVACYIVVRKRREAAADTDTKE